MNTNDIKIYKRIIFVLLCLVTLFAGLSIISLIAYNYKDKQLSSNMNDYNKLQKEFTNYKHNYKFMQDEYDNFVSTISELNRINKELDASNSELKHDNNLLYNNYKELNDRAELYDKYEYALEPDGFKSDLTYDQIRTLEELMKTSKVNDTDFILSIIMTESGGKSDAANDHSDAKGYGQLLNSTAKYAYEDLLKMGTWYQDVSFDGETNIKMMVATIDYLYEFNNGNLYKTIDSYRGLHSEAYLSSINKYLSYKGKTIDTVAKELSSRN